MSDNENSGMIWGCLFAILIFAYAIAQIWAGYLGIADYCGSGWAIAAVVVALLFRFSLPITIGSFFGAMNVWGWHWIFALIFAAPGLAFMALLIPGMLAETLKKFKD